MSDDVRWQCQLKCWVFPKVRTLDFDTWGWDSTTVTRRSPLSQFTAPNLRPDPTGGRMYPSSTRNLARPSCKYAGSLRRECLQIWSTRFSEAGRVFASRITINKSERSIRAVTILSRRGKTISWPLSSRLYLLIYGGWKQCVSLIRGKEAAAAPDPW